MSDLIRAGLQIPLFTYSDAGPADIFDRVAAQAEAAEDSGFDSVWVMDHFWQLPMLGNPEQEMLEAYTTLGSARGADVAGQPRNARHRCHLPEPDPAGQDRHHARRHLARPGDLRHRGGLVRRRTRRPRLRLPAPQGPLRDARGSAGHPPSDVLRGEPHVRRQALPHGQRVQFAGSGPLRWSPDHGGRIRRAEDPPARRPPRRRHQPVGGPRRAPRKVEIIERSLA